MHNVSDTQWIWSWREHFQSGRTIVPGGICNWGDQGMGSMGTTAVFHTKLFAQKAHSLRLPVISCTVAWINCNRDCNKGGSCSVCGEADHITSAGGSYGLHLIYFSLQQDINVIQICWMHQASYLFSGRCFLAGIHVSWVQTRQVPSSIIVLWTCSQSKCNIINWWLHWERARCKPHHIEILHETLLNMGHVLSLSGQDQLFGNKQGMIVEAQEEAIFTKPYLQALCACWMAFLFSSSKTTKTAMVIKPHYNSSKKHCTVEKHPTKFRLEPSSQRCPSYSFWVNQHQTNVWGSLIYPTCLHGLWHCLIHFAVPPTPRILHCVWRKLYPYLCISTSGA